MNRTLSLSVLALTILAGGPLYAADPPSAEITNGQIKAKICLPDQRHGFYHSTRFDWSGIVCHMEYQGHVFYTPWWYKLDLQTYDFGYDDTGVISAPFTALAGPGEEFNSTGGPLNFADAPFGGTFVKIGVGVLRKPKQGEPPIPMPPVRGVSPAAVAAGANNNGPGGAGSGTPPAGAPAGGGRAGGPDRYDHSRVYDIVDPGKWTIKKNKNSVEFIQEINDTADGYGYVYDKVVRLVPGKPEMMIEHRLKNTGAKPIVGTVYNHNMFTPDGGGPNKDLTITFPFKIVSTRPPAAGLIESIDNKLVYLKTLVDKDRGTANPGGFGDTATDYDVRVEDKKTGVGYQVVGDKPIASITVWSIKTVQAVEPYISYSIDPGKEFTWNLHYDYFVNSPGK
jgi:hypothetical protein